jgi:hypothetical protein
MNTSYFSSPRIKNKNLNLVSIAKKSPAWIKCKTYDLLCPSWDLVMPYKQDQITKEQYTEIYIKGWLNKLDPAKTYQELGEDAVLLCWERSGFFCHRHIVAKWLMDNLNITIIELE